MLKISPKFRFLNNISIFSKIWSKRLKIEIFAKNLNDPSKVVGQTQQFFVSKVAFAKLEFAANRAENRIFD